MTDPPLNPPSSETGSGTSRSGTPAPARTSSSSSSSARKRRKNYKNRALRSPSSSSSSLRNSSSEPQNQQQHHNRNNVDSARNAEDTVMDNNNEEFIEHDDNDSVYRMSYHSSSSHHHHTTSDAFRRVSRASRHAAVRTKEKVWDSNELSIEAAVSAVDQWEAAYNALRSLIVQSVHSAATLYDAAKEGAGQLEHGLLMPVRDWILLPAFMLTERACSETVHFLQSPAARTAAEQTLQVARQVPVVGPNLLAPGLYFSGVAVQRTWHVLQYPIPSKERVRSTVDWSLNSTKYLLTVTAREISLYVQRADANITRTLSHTQWKVLGSGPYATLSETNKEFVIDHLCERYFSLCGNSDAGGGAPNSEKARYELAAHCQRHNPALYEDLVVTGLLQQRGGDLTAQDEWLSATPVYRDEAFWRMIAEDEDEDTKENDENNQNVPEHDVPFLMADHFIDSIDDRLLRKPQQQHRVQALWFRWPSVNGKPPHRDSPWIPFALSEQAVLEERYQQIVRQGGGRGGVRADADISGKKENEDADQEGSAATASRVGGDDDGGSGDDLISVPIGAPLAPAAAADAAAADDDDESTTPRARRQHGPARPSNPPPTIAQWYTPTAQDVLVDQQRHAVSFLGVCPKCRQPHTQKVEEEGEEGPADTAERAAAVTVPYNYGEDCNTCRLLTSDGGDTSVVSTDGKSTPAPTTTTTLHQQEQERQQQPFGPPPLAMRMRPTFWRFYGPGDEVRRSTWFLDTSRNGLQPFDDEAQTVLEDAYLFLKWMSYRRSIDPEHLVKKDADSGEGVNESLLTVEVTCPDGTERLVQFGSLTQATAIQKGLGAAIAVFKRRVYRGAWLARNNSQNDESADPSGRVPTVEEAIAQAAQDNGTMGETIVPDVSIRSILEPPLSPQPRMSGEVDLLPPPYACIDFDASLAVPPERLASEDMARYLRGERDGKVEHLCLIVHGIGEMLRSIDVFGMSLQNLSEACGSMRANHAQVTDAHFSQMYPTADATARASTGRVEYLPVEWHESFSILTQRRAPLLQSSSSSTSTGETVMISDISLRTIPNMREFANDTLMDVLFFMSPEHHDVIIDVVTHEMNLVVEKFRRTTGFNGSISVIGHSLGSIISWDILQNTAASPPEIPLRNVGSFESMGSGYFTPGSQGERSDTPELTTPTPSLPANTQSQQSSVYPQLDFTVDNFFMLGSPVPVFLMIRNQRMPLSEDFYLGGCRRVFNIFHPYDPVAYRVEPCISPRNSDYEPTIVKHWNGGFRVQYRTRRLWRKLIETTAMTQRNVVEAFEQSMAGMGLLDATVEAGGEDDDSTSEVSEDRSTHNFVVTGQLNQGRRIDYMLQEKEIENANEYVAALAAHSSYWIEKDLSLFIARQIYLSTLEFSAAEAEAAEQANWEAITPEDWKV